MSAPCLPRSAHRCAERLLLRRTRRLRRLGLVAVTWLSGALPASAQQWEFQPRANVQASYEDNIRLQPDNPQGGLGSRLSATALALRTTEATRLGLTAQLRLNDFADASDLDNGAAFFGADWSYQRARSEFQLNQSFITQSTLTSELATTGVTNVNRQQYRYQVRPDWSYRLDEVSTLSIGASYEDVFYDDVQGTPLSNFRSGSLSFAANRRMSERWALNLVTVYGRFQSQGGDSDTESLGVQLGVDYELSETFRVSALAGLRQTRVDVLETAGLRVTDDTSGPIYSLSAQKQFASGAVFRALAVRELTPSGASEVLDSTRLQLNYSYPINERMRFSLSSQAYRNRQLGDEAESQGTVGNRDYADGTMTLSYRLGRVWRLVVDYRYRWQQNVDSSVSASSNRVGISLAWHGR